MRVKIAFFFTLLFSISLITPTVISFVDDTQEFAFFLDMNEEDEKKGKESAIDFEKKITTRNVSVNSQVSHYNRILTCQARLYTSPELNRKNNIVFKT